MNKRAIGIVIVVAVIAGVLAATKPWESNNGNGALVLYGNVDIRELQLAFRVGGRIAGMEFEEGDAVAPGDLVATLDDQPYRDSLAIAAAALQEAQARLAALRSGSRQQEIDQARARVDEAGAAMRRAEQDLGRQNRLLPDGVSSQRQVDAARAASSQAAARLAASRDALALLVEGPRSEDIAAAEAAVAAARAQQNMAQTRLDDTRLIAPGAGTIMTRVREPGAMIAAGQTVYAVSLSEVVYVRAYVAGPDLGRVTPGTAVGITSDSSTKRYNGQVGFVSPRAEFTPKTVETPELRTDLVYRLRIVVTDADDALRQGMPVTVEF